MLRAVEHPAAGPRPDDPRAPRGHDRDRGFGDGDGVGVGSDRRRADVRLDGERAERGIVQPRELGQPDDDIRATGHVQHGLHRYRFAGDDDGRDI